MDRKRKSFLSVWMYEAVVYKNNVEVGYAIIFQAPTGMQVADLYCSDGSPLPNGEWYDLTIKDKPAELAVMPWQIM